jgi:hypothetical protein
LASDGFAIQLLADDRRKDVRTIQASKALIPSPDLLTSLRHEFSGLAAANGGTYDGWGAEVVR